MTRTSNSALACALALTACHERHPLGGEEQRWLELKSEHFLVRTDVPEDDARRRVHELEVTRSALLDAFALSGAVAGHLPLFRVLLLESLAEVEEMYPERDLFGFTTEGWLGAPIFVISADRDLSKAAALKHELTHSFTEAVLGPHPPWLAEGLATFLETMHTRGESEVVGELNVPIARRLRGGRAMPVREALTVRDAGALGDQGRLFEDTAYAIFFALFNQDEPRLAGYLRALNRGEGREAALAAALRGVDLDALDARIASMFSDRAMAAANGQLKIDGFTALVKRKPYAGKIAWHELRAAEVHAQLAEVFLGSSTQSARAEDELRLAFDDDPAQPLALAVELGRAHPSAAERIDAARGAKAAHPDDWRAWILLVGALNDASDAASRTGDSALPSLAAEAISEAKAAAAFAPDESAVPGLCARVLAARGEPLEALPLALQAEALDPAEPRRPLLVAHILALLQRTAEAQAALARAMAKTREGAGAAFLALEREKRLVQHDLAK